MGQKETKPVVPFPEDMLDMYIRSEFNAMDFDKDGKLTGQEVRDLLTFLGYSRSKQCKQKLKALNVPKRKNTVGLEDYVSAMKDDPTLVKKTEKFRQLFKIFDKNQDGWVSKEEMVSGLEKLDIKVDESLKVTIDKMDANNDGKVSYQEFLTMEFQIALKLKEEEKKTHPILGDD